MVRLISAKKGEPDWMLEFRLKAFHYWEGLEQPTWGHLDIPPIDYQAISYYADPLAKKPKNKEIDPELEKTFDKLGIPLEERLALSGTAVDAIMDSVSVKTNLIVMGCPYRDLRRDVLEEIAVIADLQVHLAELRILGGTQSSAEPFACELHACADPENGELCLIQILAVVAHGILVRCNVGRTS